MSRSMAAFCLLLLSVKAAEQRDVPGLLQELKQELRYETVLLLHNASDHCPTSLQLKTLEEPLLLINSQARFYLKREMSSRMLALVCLSNDEAADEPLLHSLYANLQHMRWTTTLLLLRRSTDRLRQLFLGCLQHKMLNVLALSWEDWQLHSYRAYPRFELLEHNWTAPYFEDRLRDLRGHGIRTMPDHVVPRSVVHRDGAGGERRLAGYVARLLETFAWSRNATLNIRWNEERLYFPAIADLSYAGELDLPMSMIDYTNTQQYTYPVELSKWQLMLPVEAELPSNELFFKVFQRPAGLLIASAMLLTTALATVEQMARKGVRMARPLQCLDQVLRSYLGQAPPMPRRLTLTRALLGWLMAQYGVLLSNIYMAYLQMLYAHTPTEPEVRSYEDMRQSPRRILLIEQERIKLLRDWGHAFWQSYADLFLLTNSTAQFHHLRSGLNTSYVYPVTTSLWTMLQERQSTLKRPLFRIASQFVWSEMMPFSLAVEQNSVYKEAFNAYLGWVKAAGLLEHWHKAAYFEMVQLRELPFYQAEGPRVYRDMIWQDFHFIWLGYALFCVFSCVAFIGELLWARFGWRKGALRVFDYIRRLL